VLLTTFLLLHLLVVVYNAAENHNLPGPEGFGNI